MWHNVWVFAKGHSEKTEDRTVVKNELSPESGSVLLFNGLKDGQYPFDWSLRTRRSM